MSTNLKIVAIIVLAVMFAVMAIAIYALNEKLEDAEIQLSNAHTELAKLNDMCKIMHDTLRRQDAAISEYIAAQTKSQDANVHRIETIERAEDACEWLDDALPASVSVLLRDACRSANSEDHAAESAD